jgi:hypothetical protein
MYINIANPLLLYRPVYTDVALKVLREAGSLRSACELVHVIKDLVMANRVLIVYMVHFFLASLQITNLPNVSKYTVHLYVSIIRGRLT